MYSEARCFSSQTVIAFTGGIPDGLLHCLHAAAHSGEDKSLSAIHHRLRWKNGVKIPRFTSQRNLQQETTGMILCRHTCDHCYLGFLSSLYFTPLCFVFLCTIFILLYFLTFVSNFTFFTYFIFSCIEGFFLILSFPPQI